MSILSQPKIITSRVFEIKFSSVPGNDEGNWEHFSLNFMQKRTKTLFGIILVHSCTLLKEFYSKICVLF